MLRSTETKNISHKEVVKTMVKHLPKDKENIMTVADWLREEGREQGMKQGLQQGIQQGEEIGMHQAKLQIAIELLREGRSVNDVCKITKLLTEEVVALQNQIQH